MPAFVFAHPAGLIGVLFGVPSAYVLISYGYLAWWHKKLWLFNTVVHENGRLTLVGSLFYFDHFVSHVPMAGVFALCAAGGIAVQAGVPFDVHLAHRAWQAATILMSAAIALVVLSFGGSLLVAGWQRTIDYLLQRIERDGVMSRGGLWNELQLSNVPIALGAIGIGGALQTVTTGRAAAGDVRLFAGGMALIAAAAAVLVVMSLATWQSWTAFRNPRWLAHSMREVATFPLTGIPVALASVVLVQYVLTGPSTWIARPQWLSLALIGLATSIVAIEFAFVRSADILAIAQKPSFAGERMSIWYLLASHVFEHALDFVFMGLFAGGAYALAETTSATTARLFFLLNARAG